MSEAVVGGQELLLRVAERLSKTPATTDHLMLTRWRVLSMCQHLLGGPFLELGEACTAALEAFVLHGAGAAADNALEAAGAVIRRTEGSNQSVLPTISAEKRQAVINELNALAASGPSAISRALDVLPRVRERIAAAAQETPLPGIRHRLEIAATILGDGRRPDDERVRAAAAVLYVDEVRDVIPDTLDALGMLDDDYALRIVLEELREDRQGAHLHWSETISSLWDDLPFLQGVNLQRNDRPISVTWLDRVNSYVSYSHVLGLEKAPLVLLQPSVACSPLHAIVSLIGLLVLDAVTSTQNKAMTLRTGQTYELDGLFVCFEGVAGPPTPGWLKLRVRGGAVYQPPGIADRMVPVDAHGLSTLREFSSRPRVPYADPMQRFFDWDAAIGPASISSRLVLVTSRRRALDLLEGVQSNGVRLLDHGLVRFVGVAPSIIETHGTLLLVVPTLCAARHLVERGVRLQAILVDGYERLHRGRHDLPLLMSQDGSPPVISWSATGYYPAAPPGWLPPHRRLEVSSGDLAGILELEEPSTDATQGSLWEAATGIGVQSRLVAFPSNERGLAEELDAYVKAVRSSTQLPEYWQYHLTTLAKTLRILAVATPARWSDIRRYASSWSASMDEKWLSLRPAAAQALAALREAERRVITAINQVHEPLNSRASALRAVLAEPGARNEKWYFACDRPEQAKVVASLVRDLGLRGIEPVLLRDLAVCSSCLVAGWTSGTFARRLWAHTPRTLLALVDEDARARWERASETHHRPGGQSLLSALGAAAAENAKGGSSPISVVPEDFEPDDAGAPDPFPRVPCVFVWLTGEPEAKVLARERRVVVEEGDVVRERAAASLQPDDRVILGSGSSRWSPADEFTEAVVEAVRASHPEIVRSAKEWRRALLVLQSSQQLSLVQLQARLSAVGVRRETQTLEGWLQMERAAPIGPRGLRSELELLWPLVEHHAEQSLDEVVAACARLRSLRIAAGRALLQLWKGRTVELGVEESWLDDLVERLRQEVHVYEVEAVSLGDVPEAMLGWWIPSTVAARFESEDAQVPPTSEGAGEDELGAT